MVQRALAHVCACIRADWKIGDLCRAIDCSKATAHRLMDAPSTRRWHDGQLAALADLEFELYGTEHLRIALMVRASRRPAPTVITWLAQSTAVGLIMVCSFACPDVQIRRPRRYRSAVRREQVEQLTADAA